ncbi:MAG: glucose-6-phosphate isomerase [Bacillota bacterium]
MPSITHSGAWKKLVKHKAKLNRAVSGSRLWDDEKRVKAFTIELPGLHVDYSRNLVTAETLKLLVNLATAAKLADWRKRLFAGERVNSTEDRAALHILLRGDGQDVPAGLKPQAAEVQGTLERMRAFTAEIHGSGRFTDVINIGIGGSHLGPELVVDALSPLAGPRLRVHFLSNVDPMHTARLLRPLDPARTLVIVTSKTFTTQETLANARAVRAWLSQALGEGRVAEHFVAVTAAPDKAREFGIRAERIFAFWDWVGGRYSLWSAVGLPIALSLGFDAFESLLRGAARMDRHFLKAPPQRNLPVLLALIGVWYANFWKASSRVVVPYRHDLRLLVPYLQQLEMESNGKRVNRRGQPVKYATAPVVWGDVGTNSQHAFFQHLHQGTQLIPVDFIAVLEEESGNRRHQAMLLANCYAQAEALLRGRSLAEARRAANGHLAPHKTFPGKRPSNLIVLQRLDAESLGMLLALYEHRTFVQACIWDINPFDQMGVELGKQLAEGVLKALESGDTASLKDPATRAAVKRSGHA